jgi:type VI secretion system protein ImpK
MRDEISNLVFPVIHYGLSLKSRLVAGEGMRLENEQAALTGLLLPESEAKRWSDYGGERASLSRSTGDAEDDAADFLGVRYALVCWLDEMFILDSPWGTQWNEQKLEASLYGTNDRAWKFWEQARRAESLSSTDALEVFMLCVMLGFRGALREEPKRLREWSAATRTRIEKSKHTVWTPPPELDPPAYVPPLRGQERLQYMLVFCGVTMLLLIPVVTFLVVARL